MSEFVVCPACAGNGKRQTKAGKDWFACENCAGERVVQVDTRPCFWCRSVGPCEHDLPRAEVTRLRESIRQHQHDLLDLLADVSDALDRDSVLYDRVQAFMDIQPDDTDVVPSDILDLIERALAAKTYPAPKADCAVCGGAPESTLHLGLGTPPGHRYEPETSDPSVETACTHDGSLHTWREGCPS